MEYKQGHNNNGSKKLWAYTYFFQKKLSKHGPPYIDAAGITLSNLSHIDKLNLLDAEWTDALTFTFPSR
jgi:hypothetical protein